MYCGKCGQQLSENAKFCPKCGWKVEQADFADRKQEIPEKETKQQGASDNTGQKTERRKRKKWPWILAGLILIAAVGIAAGFLIHEKQVKERYEGALADADRYLEELDYENAEASYLKAISIDAKKEEPYLKLADLYVENHQPEKAVEIVRQGQESVPSADAKEELSGKAEEWKALESYTWAVEPEVEADEIYYLQSRDFYASSENERCRQMESDYAVVRQGEQYGLIDMEGNLLEGMDYTTVGTILGYYEVTLAEPRYTSEYRTEMSDFYLAESGELEPAVAMFGDVFGSQGEYYYCDGLHNTVESMLFTGGNRTWELYELTTSIPVKQMPLVYDEAIETQATDAANGEVWLERAILPYAIWDGDELKTDFIYDECGSESSGLLAVQQNGKWGYVDAEGKEIIPLEYDASWKHYTEEDLAYCYAATDGYVPLVKEGVWEMRNAEGSLVIAPGVFEEILPVYEGKCWVKADGKWGVISLGADAEEIPDEDTAERAGDTDENANTDKAQEKPEEIQTLSYSEIYGPLLDQVRGEYEYSEYLMYMVYDIDKDGVKELILQIGTCEADYMYDIYTVQDGNAVYIGEVSGFHSAFYEDENGGTENFIIRCSGHMSWETVSYVYLENSTLREEEISSREVPIDDTYYSNPYPIEYAYITDKSLLDKA